MTSFPEGDSLDALLPRLGENRAGRQLVAGLRGDDGHLARADIDPAEDPDEREQTKHDEQDGDNYANGELGSIAHLVSDLFFLLLLPHLANLFEVNVHFAPPFSFAKVLLAGIPIISRGSSAVTTSVTRGAVFS